MYRKEDILRKLNEDNYYIDLRALDTFIKEWQIDAIYESQDGTEFFDDLSVGKIKKGISLKSQGYNKEQIAFRINKAASEVEEEQTDVVEEVSQQSVPEVRNVTLNVTNQTLQMLAEAVAHKITDDIKNHIDSSQFAESLVQAGTYKKDNEILSKQVEKLLDDNNMLAKRIQHLEEKSRPFWKRIFD